jgi:hypothetical protein
MLTKKQREVARAMYDGVLGEEQIRAKYGVNSRQMKRWQEDKEFQRELQRLCEQSVRETSFILTRYGPAAAWKLVELLNGEKPDITRRAALDLIDRCVQSVGEGETNKAQPNPADPASLTEEQALRILEKLAQGLSS